MTDDLSLRAARAADEEERFFVEGLRSLRDHPPAVGDTPVTVISGMKSTIFDRSIRQAFVAAHQRTAARLHARHVEAARSNHHVVVSEPQLVAEEIIRIAGDQRRLTVHEQSIELRPAD